MTRCTRLVRDDGEDVLLGQDQEILVVELELGAGILGEEHLVADLTSSGMRLPSSSRRPSPAATTVPRCGFSLAVSGRTIPVLVVSSRPEGRTTTRSPSGRSFAATSVPLDLRLRHDRFLQPHRLTEPPPGYRSPSQLQPTRARRIVCRDLALFKGEC